MRTTAPSSAWSWVHRSVPGKVDTGFGFGKRNQQETSTKARVMRAFLIQRSRCSALEPQPSDLVIGRLLDFRVFGDFALVFTLIEQFDLLEILDGLG